MAAPTRPQEPPVWSFAEEVAEAKPWQSGLRSGAMKLSPSWPPGCLGFCPPAKSRAVSGHSRGTSLGQGTPLTLPNLSSVPLTETEAWMPSSAQHPLRARL